MDQPWRSVIADVQALVTKKEARRQGFLHQALTKVERASPYVHVARRLHQTLQPLSYDEILALQSHRSELLAAAGISTKALSHLNEQDRTYVARQALVAIYAEAVKEHADDPMLAHRAFVDEVVYRYLLTKGDTLGGSMRNLIGLQGTRILTDAVVEALGQRGVQPQVRTSQKEKVAAIRWPDRLMVFDKTTGLFGKNNVDVILLNTHGWGGAHSSSEDWPDSAQLRSLLQDPAYYLACGEVKGGIDPAGADEHWKTASSALARIRKGFAVRERQPGLFYAGAAIEQAMAREIFQALEEGSLDFAANLTVIEQVSALTSWLITL